MSPKNPSQSFRPFNVESMILYKKENNSSGDLKRGGSDKMNHREAIETSFIVRAPRAQHLSAVRD